MAQNGACLILYIQMDKKGLRCNCKNGLFRIFKDSNNLSSNVCWTLILLPACGESTISCKEILELLSGGYI